MLQELFPYLPLIAVIIPLFSFMMIIFAQDVPWWRNSWSIIGSAGTLISVALMYLSLAQGQIITFKLPMIVTPYNFFFRVDEFGFLFALIISFVWFTATIFALEYMNHEENRGRFFAFFMLTLCGTVGVPLAGDLLTLLLFFELMSLASYVLVVHTQTKEAVSAGNLYLYLGIFGGMCLLTGIGLFYFQCGSLTIAPQSCLLEGLDNYYIVAAALMIIGFGIKAGMIPLHIWLPRAHPVAPAPASALLSGIMIKTGAYGIIRTISLIYTPEASTTGTDIITWATSLQTEVAEWGYLIIWIGIITMFLGFFLALLQNNIKKLLACSSISQIGYIIMGAGVGAYLGYEGAMGIAGATYHVFNHAFFKSTLFLAAGSIAFLTGELDMRRLGDLKKTMPFTTIVVLIASLGIVGMPLFNGYASKTLLHHAIVEAYEHHHVYSLYIAEKIFTLTSAGTVCYFLKFLYFTFWRPAQTNPGKIKTEPLLMKISMGTLAVSMIIIGISPYFILHNLIVPALNAFTLDPHLVEYLSNTNLFIVKDLTAVALALGLGTVLFFLARYSGLFNLSIPYWLGLEYYGVLTFRLAVVLWTILTLPFIAVQNYLSIFSQRLFNRIFLLLQNVDYRPGESTLFRSINIRNIEFDMTLVLIALSIILAVAFFLRFGLSLLI
ncbi:MAG: proton-conducting transporter membrane subunit [Bacillota bacterium]